ncbi:FAD-binding domain-containing protein [Thozetella sp. PMI_491]|nr:FAD-binding domain-containing protein [Thozetella sp. PMI_491]
MHVGLETLSRCLLASVGGNSSLVLFPSQKAFSSTVDASKYNLDVQDKPAAIVYPETPDQVSAAVKCAADCGIKIQARSGGHSYGNYGLSSGQLSVDLRNLQAISIDQSSGLATVGAGTLLGQLNEKLWGSGQRYIPHGLTFSIGIGGHATVGGFGITSRLVGFATDHVVEVEIVLANSSVVRASNSQNQDLFFATRGAAASFGIVTEFVFQSIPAPPSVISYAYVWTAQDSPSRAAVLKAWQKWNSEADVPWELSSTLTLNPAVVVISGGFVGTQSEFDNLNLTSYFPTAQSATAEAYTDYRLFSEAMNEAFDATGQATQAYFYAKSLFFNKETSLSEDAIDRLVEHLDGAKNGTQAWAVNFELGGGYVGTIPANATAYPWRDITYAMLSYGQTHGPVTQTTFQFLDGASTFAASGKSSAVYGQYAGFVDPRENNDKARQAYWGPNLERLERIKAVVDPDDVFHNQQSVAPAAKGTR